MNHTFALSALLLFLLGLSALFLLSPKQHAASGEAIAPYFELADAPTIAVDWSKGNSQSVTLGGNRTLTFTNGQKGGKYLLIVKQDATGSRTVTWPSSVRWPGPTQAAVPPTLTTTANKTDYITFFYNGVNYDALALAQNY